MLTEKIKKQIIKLVEGAKLAYVSSVDEDGFPNTKAMLSLQRDGLFTHYFSTNLSAKRTQRFMQNPKSCVYFCDQRFFKGLMLVGNMEVLTDREHKAMLWRKGFERYYPDGIETQDYCVLKFTSNSGNYYHVLANHAFGKQEF